MSGTRQDPQFAYDPGTYQFCPPRNNPWLIRLARKFTTRGLSSVGINEVVIDSHDLARLQAHTSSRVILASNHPAYEPLVLFHLSGLVDKELNIMAARELFTKSWLHRLLLPLLGAYSVNRGVSDAESFKETRRIISEGKRWLVVFPEGQDHYMSDLLMPFSAGIIRLGFWALDALKDDGPPPVRCFPIAIRYHFTRDMRDEIEASLIRLESALNLYAADTTHSHYDRLLRISARMIEDNEGYYRLAADINLPLKDRIDRLRNLVIERVASAIGVAVPSMDLPLRDRVRQLLNALDTVRPPDLDERSEYVKNLVAKGEQFAAELHSELYRVLTFIGVSGNYVASRPTAERFCDVLSRLEYETIGSAPNFGPKCARILVGKPINLTEHYAAYREDRRQVPEQLSGRLEDEVRALLEGSSHLMTRYDCGQPPPVSQSG